MNVSFLSTSSPTLALASPTRVKSVLTKPHIRVPQLRVRSVEGKEERKLASSQTDRQTDTRETTRDLWNRKTIEPTVHQIRERTKGQRDTLDIAARNDRSKSLQYPNGWFRFVHG